MNKIVSNIIEKVKTNGDSAITFFTEKYDGLKLLPKNFKVSDNEILSAFKSVDKNFLNSIILAKENIEVFQNKIFPKSTIIKKSGIVLKHIFKPLDSVGIYIPGGRFSYPSTILMTAIPAKIAGVKKIIITTPFKNLSNEVLATAKICGVNEIYRIGGAQAIASLAYGTETIPKVDKIVGPGNAYVTEAKKQVYGDVGIDMLAGPSEILIIADESVKMQFITEDLKAQCEHDKNSKAVLISMSKRLTKTIKKNISLFKKQIKIINVDSIVQAIKIANQIAPEHLEIMTKNPQYIADKVKNAGAVFIGNYSPVALGDYFAGPSHVLPTGRNARFSSGLSVYDFLKSSSYIHYKKSALKKSASSIIKLANTEGLSKHAESIKVRVNDSNG
ncbi:MAG: histidinol dehydrogenase [Elusimicrobia bacterium RIFOXYD2_FULL_34_15]|nr:MAG: histidinol dehydrogenase [Elusimicrobia bacterium RIFOXYD2_FULL_34_15]